MVCGYVWLGQFVRYNTALSRPNCQLVSHGPSTKSAIGHDQLCAYEVVALLTSPLKVPRQHLIGFVNSIKTSPYVEVVHVDAALDEQAWQLLTARQDKEWSLVDCVSFVLMQQRSLYYALTNDHHFEQAGYVRLLK